MKEVIVNVIKLVASIRAVALLSHRQWFSCWVAIRRIKATRVTTVFLDYPISFLVLQFVFALVLLLSRRRILWLIDNI